MTSAPAFPARGGVRTASWVLYDLANTIYSASLTFLFTPYVQSRYGAVSGFTVALFASMVLAALLVPMLGAVTDLTLRTRRYLTVATLCCVAAFACFGVDRGEAALLVCFFVANVAYNLALLFYNALLPSVAPAATAGRVSAIGVGVGYAGTILVVVALFPLDMPATAKFPLAALLFLLFALPCLLLVRDLRPSPQGDTAVAVRRAYGALATTLRELPRHRALFWFLLANFCFADVLNTAIFFFAELTLSTFEPAARAGEMELLGFALTGEDGLRIFVLVCALTLNGLALLFGLSIARWTDRAPLAVLRCSGVALLGALIGGALFGGSSPLGYLLTLVTLGAFGLTGTWSAGRKVVVLLAPPAKIGQYFGLYGITLKLSVLGALVYGLVRDSWDAQAALLSQTPQLCLGLLFLSMVRLPQPAVPTSSR